MITKRRIRSWFHLAGLMIVGSAGTWVWFREDLGLPVSVKIGATIVLITTLFTKWDGVVEPRFMRYVDTLPIPDTETTTTTTTTVTTSPTPSANDNQDGVPDNSSQLDVTGVHGKGNLP